MSPKPSKKSKKGVPDPRELRVKAWLGEDYETPSSTDTLSSGASRHSELRSPSVTPTYSDELEGVEKKDKEDRNKKERKGRKKRGKKGGPTDDKEKGNKKGDNDDEDDNVSHSSSSPSEDTIISQHNSLYEGEFRPGKRRRPTPMHENYQIRMGDSWTVSDDTFLRQPMFKRRKLDAPYSDYINHTYRSTTGLSALQLGHNVPVNLSAMSIACEHLWKCLQNEVRAKVLVPPPNGPALWSANQQDFNEIWAGLQRPELQDTQSKQYLFYTDMKKHPWIVWPLWVEDEFGADFVTALIYSEPAFPEEAPGVFDRVFGFTIIDPRRAEYGTRKEGEPETTPLRRAFPMARTRRINIALLEFLRQGNYQLDLVPLTTKGYDKKTKKSFNLKPEEIRLPMMITNCSPMPSGEVTSGERCFATVKELLSRITEWYLAPKNIAKKVFRDLPRWVNPYQYRIEMTGINAWTLMATLDYNARIVVELMPDEPIPVAVDGQRMRYWPYDLAGPNKEPALAPSDWLLPGQAPPHATAAAS